MAKVEYLDELPEFANPELEDVLRVWATVETQGSATVRVELPFRGVVAERVLERMNGLTDDNAEIAVRQLALNMFSGAENVRGDLKETADGALLTVTLDLERACEVGGDRMTCRALPVSRLLSPALAALPERKFPLVLQLPIQQRIEVEIKVPGGWAIERGPRRDRNGVGMGEGDARADAGRT